MLIRTVLQLRTTYTPFITPVVPTAEPATSTDIQGANTNRQTKLYRRQSAVPMDDDVPATFVDGSTTKVVEGVGTYTVAPDGTVTFVPENHSLELHQCNCGSSR